MTHLLSPRLLPQGHVVSCRNDFYCSFLSERFTVKQEDTNVGFSKERGDAEVYTASGTREPSNHSAQSQRTPHSFSFSSLPSLFTLTGFTLTWT